MQDQHMLTQSSCCLLNFSSVFTVGPQGFLPWVLVNSFSLLLFSYRMFSSRVDKLACSLLSVIIWDSKQFFCSPRSFTSLIIFPQLPHGPQEMSLRNIWTLWCMKLNYYSRGHRTSGTWGLL